MSESETEPVAGQRLKPLQCPQHMSEFTTSVRQRIIDEMRKLNISQRDMAGQLEWSQSRVAKILKGRVEMGISDLEAMCFIVGISKVEAVRDRGMEFCADLTPTELRLIEKLRKKPKALAAVMDLLDIETSPSDAKTARPRRKGVFGKPRPR